jgi:hypothetical protein
MDKLSGVFVFDYGNLAIEVRYVSAGRLQWEQLKGAEAGLKGEERYDFAEIRRGVYFLWWQEKDGSVVTQVVDFEKRLVHTTWISPDRKLAAFKGTVTAKAS